MKRPTKDAQVPREPAAPQPFVSSPARGPLMNSADQIDATLNKHFVITETAFDCPRSWNETPFDSFRVFSGPDVRRHPILDRDGQTRGLALGWIVGKAGLLPDETPIRIDDSEKCPLSWLDHLSGRYIAVIGSPKLEEPVLITDAAGLLPAVYSKAHRTVASTPLMLARLLDLCSDDEVKRLFPIPEVRGWIPFGLTQVEGVRRLLPNHLLTLGSFVQNRFWPSAGYVDKYLIYNNSCENNITKHVFNIVSESVRSLMYERDLFFHLTAGYDSRMILASSINHAGNKRFITVKTPTEGGVIDRIVSEKLAEKFNLNHELRFFTHPTEDDIAEWHRRTGYCISDYVERLATTSKTWNSGEIQVTGGCGEVGRAFYWSEADLEKKKPAPETLVRRMGFPAEPRLLTEAAAWLEGLPDLHAPHIFDLAYIEQRLACWAGPSVYGSFQKVPSISPFNSRLTYKSLLALPCRYRLRNRFARQFISLGSPELLRIPINSLPGLHRLRFPITTMKQLIPKSTKDRLRVLLHKWR